MLMLWLIVAPPILVPPNSAAVVGKTPPFRNISLERFALTVIGIDAVKPLQLI